MKINTTTLQHLDASKSYYLSDTGEIKKSGFTQWFKCVFNIGDGRAKAAALAVRVKEALLADGAVASDAALDGEIAGLNTTRSLSGAALIAIANRFRTSHAEAVGRADAKRLAEDLAETLAADWAKSRSTHPDPVSVGYMKRLAVYAASPVIAHAADYADTATLERAIRTKMNLLNTYVGSAGMYNWQSRLGYPAEQSVTLPDGKKVHMSGPYLKIDDIHFRLILASMVGRDGDVRMVNFFDALYRVPECDLRGLKKSIMAIPLPDAARPGSVVEYMNAFKAAYNAHVIDMARTAGNLGDLPKRIDDGLNSLLAEMRGIYGEAAVPTNAKFLNYVAGSRFTDDVQPLVDTANAEHRLLHQSDVVDALREKCRFSVAAQFVNKKAEAFAAANNLGKADLSVGFDLLNGNAEFRDELLACKSIGEADAVFAKYEGAVRARITLSNAANAEKGRLKDRAAAELAKALGMGVEEVKGMVDFRRLTDKADDVVRSIEKGECPGSREEGFDIAAAFNAVVDGFVRTRVDLVHEAEAAEGVSGAVKAKWKAMLLKTNKPDALHAAAMAKILSRRGDEMRDKLAATLEVGITADERAKRFCELFGVLNTEFVNLYGEEEWADMGPDERDPAFEMLLYALSDKVPDFTNKFNALRAEIEAIPEDAFANHEHLGIGDKIRDIICFAVAPEA